MWDKNNIVKVFFHDHIEQGSSVSYIGHLWVQDGLIWKLQTRIISIEFTNIDWCLRGNYIGCKNSIPTYFVTWECFTWVWDTFGADWSHYQCKFELHNFCTSCTFLFYERSSWENAWSTTKWGSHANLRTCNM